MHPVLCSYLQRVLHICDVNTARVGVGAAQVCHAASCTVKGKGHGLDEGAGHPACWWRIDYKQGGPRRGANGLHTVYTGYIRFTYVFWISDGGGEWGPGYAALADVMWVGSVHDQVERAAPGPSSRPHPNHAASYKWL